MRAVGLSCLIAIISFVQMGAGRLSIGQSAAPDKIPPSGSYASAYEENPADSALYAGWMDLWRNDLGLYPFSLNGVVCDEIMTGHCKGPQVTSFPPAPPGYSWQKLTGKFTFSAYSLADERVFAGSQMDIPGILGLQAKEDFLYSIYGVGMQGTGVIKRMDDHRTMQTIYIKYISGHWELDGEEVLIADYWYYAESGAAVPADQVSKIRLVDAKFSIVSEPKLTPYFSVAASNRFGMGTWLFVPGLDTYGGIFEVQDRGGAFGPQSQRFDLYVGKELDLALDWLRLDDLRKNLVVYVLSPN